jgi:Cys-tRNA(Pro) deacylase
MYKLIILIEPPADPMGFDEAWPGFLRHAEKMPGLVREATIQVTNTLFGNRKIHMIHELFFETQEALQAAMVSPQGQTSGIILQRLTGGHMTLLVAEHREDELENIRKYQVEEKILTSTDLQTFMDQNGIPGEIIFLETDTPTVESAAQALGTDPEHIVKSVLFTIGDERVLAITTGTQFIEQRSIAERFEVGRKRVKLAPADVVLAVSGYPVGTVPPFGHKRPIPTLIDRRVLDVPEVYAGGGAHNAMVRLHPEDILRITQAEVLDLYSPSGDTLTKRDPR